MRPWPDVFRPETIPEPGGSGDGGDPMERPGFSRDFTESFEYLAIMPQGIGDSRSAERGFLSPG
jgi:hypothetical protein